jgi:acyl carrier protein phosphodiesterase
MNYLAHAYLSFNQPEILLGNMISDYVKGKTRFDYSMGIQRGIGLHRGIDNFTDTHPVTKIAREAFRPHYRLYAGAFIDVVYDHFLAKELSVNNDNDLLTFTENVYSIVEPELEQLPIRFQRMFPYMRSQNWLYHYKSATGMRQAFGGLVRRAAYLTDSATAYTIFEQEYAFLEDCYNKFFPEVKGFTMAELGIF